MTKRKNDINESYISMQETIRLKYIADKLEILGGLRSYTPPIPIFSIFCFKQISNINLA